MDHCCLAQQQPVVHLVLGDLQVGLVALVVRLQLQGLLEVLHCLAVLLQGAVQCAVQGKLLLINRCGSHTG